VGRIAGVTAGQIRERLLAAASVVFSLKGYEGATVADIAREAGLSSGAIYSQFQSKAHLLVEAVQAHRAQVARSLLPPIRHRNVVEDLTILARRLNRGGEPNTSLLAEALVAARRDAELAAVLAAAMADSETDMAAFVRAGQESGGVDTTVSAEAVARLALILGIGGLFVRDLDLPTIAPADWSALANRLVAVIIPEEKSA
jgi:AcrR family transcriptional regulator